MSNQIDITKQVFGSKPAAVAVSGKKPPAQYWLNIGYEAEIALDNGGVEKTFINLPMGIPLDNMEEVSTTSSNQVYAAMQIAKNDLLKQLLAAGADMKSGEARTINLQIQLRKVNDVNANAGLADPTVNPFLRKLAL